MLGLIKQIISMVNVGDKTFTFLRAVWVGWLTMRIRSMMTLLELVALERKLLQWAIHVMLISFRHQNDVNEILGVICISIAKYRSRKPRYQYQHREVNIRSILWYRVDRGSSTYASLTYYVLMSPLINVWHIYSYNLIIFREKVIS